MPPIFNYRMKVGHTKFNCLKLNNKPRRKQQSSVSSIVHNSADLKKVSCKLYDSDIVALIDTASSVSLISEKLVREMGLNQGLHRNLHSAPVANEESVIFTHSISGPLMIQETFLIFIINCP